jgi:transcriptional regulator GlxA family with amidase domain
MMALMAAALPKKRSLAAERKRLGRSAELYLHGCYVSRKPVRAGDFAKNHVHFDRSHLNRLAMHVFGMSLREYLRRRQVARAAFLLRTTPLSIEDIPRWSGFASLMTFIRHFKAVHGVTPGTYRRLAAK